MPASKVSTKPSAGFTADQQSNLGKPCEIGQISRFFTGCVCHAPEGRRLRRYLSTLCARGPCKRTRPRR
jgi:hypothetical protein